MVATPLRKSIFLLSHVLNRMILSAAELLLLYGFAYYYFGIIIQGSLLALLIVFLSGYVAFAGIAVLISCRAQNTHSGNGLINFVTLPMFVLSGIFFSYHKFPDWVTPYVELLPLTMLANSLRGIVTEGIGLYDVVLPSIGLVGIGFVCFALRTKIILLALNLTKFISAKILRIFKTACFRLINTKFILTTAPNLYIFERNPKFVSNHTLKQ